MDNATDSIKDQAPGTKRIKLVISDFHLSRGHLLKNGKRNPLEDFHQDDRFREFLIHYSTGDYASAEVELIINGDFFDPLAVVPLPVPGQKFPKLEYPLEVEESAAVDKFRTIIEGHPVSMDGLKRFLQSGKKIIYPWGNHDAAVLWPAVQKLLREVWAPPRPEQLEFQQAPYVFDRICIDHGHQYEVFNHFDEDRMFIDRKSSKGVIKIQNLPFGSFFVLGFINRIRFKRSYINQVQPLRLYVRISFFLEPMFFILNGFRIFWFFIKMRFITHPMRFARLKKTLLLIGEAFHRPSLETIAERMLTGDGAAELPFDTIIMGHNHQPQIRVLHGGKQYINTGTWTPITSLDMASLGHRVLRTYCLIEYVSGRPLASLKVWHGTPKIHEDFN